jgi:hypothetical protein
MRCQTCGDVVQIRIGRDDDRRRVSELEVDPLPRSALPDPPSDRRRARERDQLDPLVLDEHIADLAGGATDDVEPAGRQAGLGLELREQECRERGDRRGLEDDGAPGCERRGELVRDEVEGKVER